MRNIEKEFARLQNGNDIRIKKSVSIKENILTYERVAGYHFIEIHTCKYDESGNTMLAHNVSYKSSL